MKKIFLIVVVFFSFFLVSTKAISAVYDPASVANNRFGIHIADTKDLKDAANLVNSSGGDWGYVTLVIAQNDRDHGRWQKAFDQMRRLHLIPLIRIATTAQGSTWQAPEEVEINNWVTFLNSLNWVVKNRYVIIGNEPNHANEWGGKVDPQAYSSYLKEFSKKLKKTSDDFFVLPAGFDASAPNSANSMDESLFIKQMLISNPDLFNYLDGWTSHSYPNPDFSGKETDRGKGTIDTFDWELAYLRSLGVDKTLPVFITETGWKHEIGEEGGISNKLKFAYEHVWNDERVVAVTPFILNYTNPPFDEFSWKKDENSFYGFYFDMQKLQKVKGKPIQEVKGDILTVLFQPVQLAGVKFSGAILARNIGQSIWNKDEVSVVGGGGSVLIKDYSYSDIEPQNLGFIFFKGLTPQVVGTHTSSVFLKYQGKQISNTAPFQIVVFKPKLVQIFSIFGKIRSFLSP